jgi:hypothetical protein
MVAKGDHFHPDMKSLGFDTRAAQRYAREGRIEEWVHGYLNTGSWANPDFSEGLKLARRWWHGPINLPLDTLTRVVGPEPDMEFLVSEAYWHGRTQMMASSLVDPLDLPPLIVEYREGELSIRDGNTRYGAMALKGWETCWVVIWYNLETDYRRHIAHLRKVVEREPCRKQDISI